ncbi:hypothetical protein FBU30_005211 [Linnemannia zychae]|nr:hypothetical protein FBU30_005211 [Linnemannia zychae]
MSQKNFDTSRIADPNQDGMTQPPPTYTTTNFRAYQPPPGPPPSGYYQAQPTPGQQTYAPPEGTYMPLLNSGGYAGNPGRDPNSVVYVVDGPYEQTSPRGIPTALICFIFGLCTWLGYLLGMCFLRSPDPRERFWARCCAIAAFFTSLIIIFGAIFGRPHYTNYNRGFYQN